MLRKLGRSNVPPFIGGTDLFRTERSNGNDTVEGAWLFRDQLTKLGAKQMNANSLARKGILCLGKLTRKEVLLLSRVLTIRDTVLCCSTMAQPAIGSDVRAQNGRHPAQRDNCANPVAFVGSRDSGRGAKGTAHRTKHPRLGPDAFEASPDNVR